MYKTSVFTVILFLSTQLPLYSYDKTKPLKFEYTNRDSSGLDPAFIVSCDHENYYQQLRVAYKLDLLIAHINNQIEQIAILMNWVHDLWQHDSDNVPSKKDAYLYFA